MRRKSSPALRVALVSAFVVPLLATGCSHSKSGGHSVSAFDVKPGECLLPPTDVKQEISSLKMIDCSKPHTQEVYATVKYDAAGSEHGAPYPGEAKLDTFANGACGQRYEGYVGIPYQDSSLFYTYLLPSARSWQDGDREVICFVTTTGEQLQASVKGSRR